VKTGKALFFGGNTVIGGTYLEKMPEMADCSPSDALLMQERVWGFPKESGV